ncbi:MAG TPA: TlpA disulfide reductase family protein [Acidimicrobiales bacterium]|nr:TlpA disulfide reductase family protein [Acidimicrobiales bacterium]
MSATTEVPTGRRSRKLVITVSVVVAIVLITVVSILTGGNQTNSSTNQLVGKHVKSFTLAGLNGGKVAAPWVSGHPSVLIFFASYCGPCKTEMPQIAKYVRTTNPTPVDVVAVDATDVRSAAQSMVRKDGVTFPVAFDPNGAVTSGIFGFGAVPESVFVNAKGIVTNVYFGAIPKKQLASGIKLLKSA